MPPSNRRQQLKRARCIQKGKQEERKRVKMLNQYDDLSEYPVYPAKLFLALRLCSDDKIFRIFSFTAEMNFGLFSEAFHTTAK
jgi:hypothetical protein